MLFDKIVHNLQQLCSEAGPVQHLGAGDDLDDVLPGQRPPVPRGLTITLRGLVIARELVNEANLKNDP